LGVLLIGVGFVWAATGPDAVHGQPSTAGQVAAERSWPCSPDSLYSQPSDTCNDTWSAFTSGIAADGSFDYTVFEDFPATLGDICGINWYGLSLLWNNGWLPCDPAGMVFDITFYAPGTLPTPVVAGPYTVTPQQTLVETCSGVYDLYYFETSSNSCVPGLSPCAVLPTGG
jgi:hypothetical protein